MPSTASRLPDAADSRMPSTAAPPPSTSSMPTPLPPTSSDAAPPPWMAAMLSVLQQQNQQMVSLMEKLLESKAATSPSPTVPMPHPPPDPYGDLVRDLPAFSYEDDDETTFKDWFKRYGPVIEDRGSSLSDDRRRNLLVDKLNRAAYKTYADYVLPLEPRQIDLSATVEKLTALFGPKRTLIRRRFEFLQSTCEPLTMSYVPYRDFGNKIKKKFEDASMKDVDSDSLKCLVFLSGLTDPSHCDTRLRLLNRLNCLKENEPSPTLDDFVNDCETYVALKSDNRTMESKDVNTTRHSTGYGKPETPPFPQREFRPTIHVTRGTSRASTRIKFDSKRQKDSFPS